MSDYLDPNNKELLNDFFEEAQGQLDTMEQNLLVLESDIDDKDCLDELFRAAHTLKGGASTVAMDEIASITHILEDVLDEIRGAKISINENIINILLDALDILKDMLKLRFEGKVYTGSDVEEIKDRLEGILLQKNIVNSVSSNFTEKSEELGENKNIKITNLKKSDVIDILDNIEKNKKCLELLVKLNEEALMNTVSAIQVFSLIKNKVGEVLKTIPDFTALNSDVFYPEVVYVVEADLDLTDRDIEDILNIPEIIKSVSIIEVNSDLLEKIGSLESVEKIDAVDKIDEPDDNDGFDDSAVLEKGVSNRKVIKSAKTSSALRVDSKKIDYLLNMVSESVINKSSINQISNNFNMLANEAIDITKDLNTQFFKILDSLPEIIEKVKSGLSLDDIIAEYRELNSNINSNVEEFKTFLKKNVNDLKNSTQKLSLNTTSLQEGIMQIRMISIGTLFARFTRVVRDLSHSLDKKVDLVLQGEDTELDKSVVEELLDPLIHCVRNCLDHGIEKPEVRKSLGKSEVATVKLKASNEGSTIVIQVSDDGAGINIEKVRKKAIERGHITKDDKLTDQDYYNMLFLPGFSTAQEVTSVSGRGVGLDVVKNHIDSLKGIINVTSEKNVGTTFTIRLPLTLAIIQGLLIRVGNDKFIIPIANVIDGHRVKKDKITKIKNVEAFEIRDEIIYLLRLSNFFGIKHNNSERENEYIIIVGNGDKKMALVVEELIGQEDVVIKPLKDDFSKSPGIAGATILGDGSVALIIDILQLIDQGLDSNFKDNSSELKIDDILVEADN